MDPKFYEIGPGWPAFVATFSLAIAAILLFRSLSKHLRKVRLEAAHKEGDATPNQAKTSGLVVEDRDGGRDVVTHEPGDGE